MRTVSEIWNFIDRFLLEGIFISVMIILIAKFVFKNKIDIGPSLLITKIILLIHSIIYIILFIISLLFNNLDHIFWTRSSGSYWWAYWSMITMNSLLPLTLMIKRLGNKKLYLLLVSILINIGWIFESFVIHMTNMNREYMGENFNPYLPSSAEFSIAIKGIIIGIFILVVGNLTKMKHIRNL